MNPNGSIMSIEGIFSPDGRVFGKMGHSSGTATLWAGTFPEISTSRCSSPVRNISSKHIFQGPGMWRTASQVF